MPTGVIWLRGVNFSNRPLIEANMKGCQVVSGLYEKEICNFHEFYT